MQQLLKLEQLSGKTIARTGYTDSRIFLFFTDDTYAVIEGCGFEERDVQVAQDYYSLRPNDFNLDELREIGVLDAPEYHRLLIKRQRLWQEHRQKHELEMLAELKKKYPNT